MPANEGEFPLNLPPKRVEEDVTLPPLPLCPCFLKALILRQGATSQVRLPSNIAETVLFGSGMDFFCPRSFPQWLLDLDQKPNPPVKRQPTQKPSLEAISPDHDFSPRTRLVQLTNTEERPDYHINFAEKPAIKAIALKKTGKARTRTS